MAELGGSVPTDEHGEAEILVPLGGLWTIDVTVPGSGLHTRVRKGLFRSGEHRLVVRYGGENPAQDDP